jgi:hypothetical protein
MCIIFGKCTYLRRHLSTAEANILQYIVLDDAARHLLSKIVEQGVDIEKSIAHMRLSNYWIRGVRASG